MTTGYGRSLLSTTELRVCKKLLALWESLKQFPDEIKEKNPNVQQHHYTMFTILQDNYRSKTFISLIILHVQPFWNHYYHFYDNLSKYKLYILLSKNIHSVLTFSITVNFFFQLMKNAATASSYSKHVVAHVQSPGTHLRLLQFFLLVVVAHDWHFTASKSTACACLSVNAHFTPNLSLKSHLY